MTDQTGNQTTNHKHGSETRLTLVLGASGKTGRRVVSRLEERGVPVRRGSRSGSPAFDWNQPDGWAAALEGVAAVYIAYVPDLAVPSAPGHLTRFTQLAVEAGVQKLVLLSGRGEDEAQRCERIVLESGIPSAVVRASWFNQNFDEGEFADMIRGGVLALPGGGVPEPFVDVEDIADVAVAALTEPGHEGEVYEVTGPRLMTYSDVAREISERTGREIRVVELSMAEFAGGLAAEGVPAGFIELLKYLFELTATGKNAYVADGVERALGRSARDFAAYADHAAGSGAWDLAGEEVARG